MRSACVKNVRKQLLNSCLKKALELHSPEGCSVGVTTHTVKNSAGIKLLLKPLLTKIHVRFFTRFRGAFFTGKYSGSVERFSWPADHQCLPAGRSLLVHSTERVQQYQSHRCLQRGVALDSRSIASCGTMLSQEYHMRPGRQISQARKKQTAGHVCAGRTLELWGWPVHQ